MPDGRTNSGGGGTGGKLKVKAPAGVQVTAEKDGRTYRRTANAQGVATFSGLTTGIWAVTISDGVQNPTTQHIQITADYEMTIAFFAAYIHAKWPEGSTCKCQKGETTLVAPSGSVGSYTFVVPETGDWTVSCENPETEEYADETRTITEDGQEESVELAYQLHASEFEFYLDEAKTTPATLGTDYEIVYDDDTAIPQSEWATAKNWKIRNLVSLYLVPLRDGEIDVFVVGGGGGTCIGNSSYAASGAGSGYTTTQKNLPLTAGMVLIIKIGSGGAVTNAYASINLYAGGVTSVEGTGISITANGGSGKREMHFGTDGGSGGAAVNRETTIEGGTDGNDGEDGYFGSGGKGQGTTTREFAEENGKLYAYGGSCIYGDVPQQLANTGNGGNGGKNKKSTPGACGIVVFRNARKRAA